MNHHSECAMAEVIETRPEHKADVLSVRCEVLWPDTSSVQLHPVRQAGQLPTFLRAVHHAGRWWLFDLQHLIPRQVEEIKQAQSRDQVGLIMYALLASHDNAAAFLAKVDRHQLDSWAGEPRRSTRSAPGGNVHPLPVVIPGGGRVHALTAQQPTTCPAAA